MPSCSVRKLCRLLLVNRQWYYQHRRPSAHQQDDQRLRVAIQEIREDFASYGYLRPVAWVRISNKSANQVQA
jgi:hypothetical protein